MWLFALPGLAQAQDFTMQAPAADPLPVVHEHVETAPPKRVGPLVTAPGHFLLLSRATQLDQVDVVRIDDLPIHRSVEGALRLVPGVAPDLTVGGQPLAYYVDGEYILR